MILLDANLLIYAVNADAAHHARARRWLERMLSGTDTVGLPWVVILAFVRITTRHGILSRPMSCAQALQFVDGWLAQPVVELLVPGKAHWSIFTNLMRASGSGGNLTSDAHIAALAIEHGAAICSADYDFRRFAGVTHLNPLE